MVDYLLYIVPTYIIGYLLVIILCKNCTLFDYINGKTTRAVTSVFIIIGAFILVTILLDRFNLSENTSKIFLGANIGVMCGLLAQIKYPIKS